VAPVSNHAEGATGPKLLGTGEVSYWSYDQFGNRKQEAFSTATTTPCASGSSGNVGNPVSRTYTAFNQDTGFIYDAAGNVIYDGLNTYLYDPEGRLCAVKNSVTTFMQYVYDAEGRRVAKGTLQTGPTSCNAPITANGRWPVHRGLIAMSGSRGQMRVPQGLVFETWDPPQAVQMVAYILLSCRTSQLPSRNMGNHEPHASEKRAFGPTAGGLAPPQSLP
jgi:YD repeat-containing protein